MNSLQAAVKSLLHTHTHTHACRDFGEARGRQYKKARSEKVLSPGGWGGKWGARGGWGPVSFAGCKCLRYSPAHIPSQGTRPWTMPGTGTEKICTLCSRGQLAACSSGAKVWEPEACNFHTQVLLLGRGAVLPLQLRPAGLGTQPLSSQGIQSKAGDPKTQA